jgi:hypothetical protein
MLLHYRNELLEIDVRVLISIRLCQHVLDLVFTNTLTLHTAHDRSQLICHDLPIPISIENPEELDKLGFVVVFVEGVHGDLELVDLLLSEWGRFCH